MARTQVASRMLHDGNVVQVAYVESAAAVSTSASFSPPAQSGGVELLTVAITPKSATNYLLVKGVVNVDCTGDTESYMCLYRDSGVGFYTSSQYTGGRMEAIHNGGSRLLAGSTSSTTFKMRIGGSNSSTFYAGGFSSTRLYSITVMEIQA